jgi:hypothetical protein
MIIAIPVSQERISPVLDAAAKLLAVNRRLGKETSRREVVPGRTHAEDESIPGGHRREVRNPAAEKRGSQLDRTT